MTRNTRVRALVALVLGLSFAGAGCKSKKQSREDMCKDGQKAFEKYRNLTCNYEQAAHPEDKNAGLFCFLRLTTQRVDDVREGLDFATTGL